MHSGACSRISQSFPAQPLWPPLAHPETNHPALSVRGWNAAPGSRSAVQMSSHGALASGCARVRGSSSGAGDRRHSGDLDQGPARPSAHHPPARVQTHRAACATRGAASTAQASDAQDARIARFSSRVRPGCPTTAVGCENIRPGLSSASKWKPGGPETSSRSAVGRVGAGWIPFRLLSPLRKTVLGSSCCTFSLLLCCCVSSARWSRSRSGAASWPPGSRAPAQS